MAQTNNIAMVFDFDYTLTELISEQPIFDYYNCKAEKFWNEKNKEYQKRLRELNKLKQVGIFDAEATLCEETVYADVLVDLVQQGKFPGLSLKKLYELGSKIKFFPGVPEFMPHLQEFMKTEERWRDHKINLEFYIISCGIEEMIKGSKVAPYLTGLFATKFSENEKGINKVIHAISYNEKTKFLYKINKGPEFDENEYVPYENRRIAKGNFYYVGDGKSDVPGFKATKNNMKGKTHAVHGRKDRPPEKSYQEAYNLLKQGRVMTMGLADYQKNSETINILKNNLTDIAANIVETSNYKP